MFFIACRTLATVASLTTSRSFRTRETVAVETPASLAIRTMDIFDYLQHITFGHCRVNPHGDHDLRPNAATPSRAAE